MWRGMYQGSQVAIKVLRVNSELDLANLERVTPFVIVLYANTPKTRCADESETVILL